MSCERYPASHRIGRDGMEVILKIVCTNKCKKFYVNEVNGRLFIGVECIVKRPCAVKIDDLIYVAGTLYVKEHREQVEKWLKELT